MFEIEAATALHRTITAALGGGDVVAAGRAAKAWSALAACWAHASGQVRCLPLFSHAKEQIRNVEQRRPAIEVLLIQCFALNLEDAHNVAPLSIGNLIAKFVPDHLMKHRILWAREGDGHLALRHIEVLYSCPRHFLS